MRLYLRNGCVCVDLGLLGHCSNELTTLPLYVVSSVSLSLTRSRPSSVAGKQRFRALLCEYGVWLWPPVDPPPNPPRNLESWLPTVSQSLEIGF